MHVETFGTRFSVHWRGRIDCERTQGERNTFSIAPSPSAVALQILFVSLPCGCHWRPWPPSCPGSPAAAFTPALFLGAPIISLWPDSMSDLISDFDPTSTHPGYVEPRLCRASALVRLDSDHIFPRQRPGSYANQAMRYLATRGRRLRSHALALDLHHELIYHVLPTSQSSNIPSRCNE